MVYECPPMTFYGHLWEQLFWDVTPGRSLLPAIGKIAAGDFLVPTNWHGTKGHIAAWNPIGKSIFGPFLDKLHFPRRDHIWSIKRFLVILSWFWSIKAYKIVWFVILSSSLWQFVSLFCLFWIHFMSFICSFPSSFYIVSYLGLILDLFYIRF